MRLGAAIVGDLRKVLADEVRAGERAAMTAIRAETDQVKWRSRRASMRRADAAVAARKACA